MAEAVARCVQCDYEVTELNNNITACPGCGSKAVPLDPRKDRLVTINTHELRILTIWASNWAVTHCDAGSKKTLSRILQRLNAQLPGVALTMFQEVKELQDAGLNATLLRSDGTVLVPPKEEPS